MGARNEVKRKRVVRDRRRKKKEESGGGRKRGRGRETMKGKRRTRMK